jgi:hypothetical protein
MPQSTEHERRKPGWRDYLSAYDRARTRMLHHPTEHHLALLRAGEEILLRELVKPGRFELGRTVMTPGVRDAMERALNIPPEFLLRHKRADWGELDEEDKRANEEALVHGSRLLSAYRTRLQDKLWVITVRLVTGWWIAAAGS